ncbi:20S-pre-rRNA D-site endonuclease nob1 [Rhizina undulata]
MTVPTPPSAAAKRSINALIVDSGPLIGNVQPALLLSKALKVYTTPSVIAEIRDAAARSRLETNWLPFLAQRAPKPESVKVVAEFAKKTGDYSVLSVTDLHLLALTYELEVEINGGDWRLRKVPGQKGINGPVPKEWEDGVKEVKQVEDKKEEDESKDETGALSEIEQKLEETYISELPAVEAEEPKEETQASETQVPEEVDDHSSDESDGGWITPSNLSKQKAKDAHEEKESSAQPARPMAAALATTDFAMQNVLLQMNLHLISPTSLQRIRIVKSWVLRCHACFKVTRDTTKQFCPSCGGATLLRASCQTDSKGDFKIFLKKNMQWNNRGNVYAIPKPQHGSASGKGVKKNLILREDQKEYEREITASKRKKERDLLDPDYLPGILTGERRDASGRPKIGYGRSNPNERRRGGGGRKL